MNALVRSSATKVAQCARPIATQKRGFIDYLTKYPDTVREMDWNSLVRKESVGVFSRRIVISVLGLCHHTILQHYTCV